MRHPVDDRLADEYEVRVAYEVADYVQDDLVVAIGFQDNFVVTVRVKDNDRLPIGNQVVVRVAVAVQVGQRHVVADGLRVRHSHDHLVFLCHWVIDGQLVRDGQHVTKQVAVRQHICDRERHRLRDRLEHRDALEQRVQVRVRVGHVVSVELRVAAAVQDGKCVSKGVALALAVKDVFCDGHEFCNYYSRLRRNQGGFGEIVFSSLWALPPVAPSWPPRLLPALAARPRCARARPRSRTPARLAPFRAGASTPCSARASAACSPSTQRASGGRPPPSHSSTTLRPIPRIAGYPSAAPGLVRGPRGSRRHRPPSERVR